MSLVLPSLIGVNKPVRESTVTNQYSVSFDGTNDYVAIASGLESTINSASALTISTWVKINKWQSTLFSSGTNGTDGIWLLPFSASQFFFSVRNGASTAITVNPSSNIGNVQLTLNNWHHVCGVLDGSNSKLYFDGTEVGNGTLPSLGSTGGSDPSIGSFQRGNYFTGGLIDEVALFNSALSASDVTALSTNGVPADISSLNPVGWWRMGEGSDGSGNTDGTLVNIGGTNFPQIYNVATDGSGNRITGIDGSLTNTASPNGIVSGTGNTP